MVVVLDASDCLTAILGYDVKYHVVTDVILLKQHTIQLGVPCFTNALYSSLIVEKGVDAVNHDHNLQL